MSMYLEPPEMSDDRQYYDYNLDRNGQSLDNEQMTPEEILESKCDEFGTFCYYEKNGGGVIDGDVRPVINSMEEYAMQESIKFSEWVYRGELREMYCYRGNGKWEFCCKC